MQRLESRATRFAALKVRREIILAHLAVRRCVRCRHQTLHVWLPSDCAFGAKIRIFKNSFSEISEKTRFAVRAAPLIFRDDCAAPALCDILSEPHVKGQTSFQSKGKRVRRAITITFLLAAVCALTAPTRTAHGQAGQERQSTAPATPSPSNAPAPRDINVRAGVRAIDASVPDDPAVTEAIAPYRARVAELEIVIGRLERELRKGGMGGGSLGNFVTDALLSRARAALPDETITMAITNSGGLRKNEIAAGDIRTRDIYELLPFENALVAVDLTGEQLLRFLRVVVSQRDAQSGARIVYRRNAAERTNEIVSVRLGSRETEREIDPAAIYTIVTIDYLVNRGGNYSVLQEARRTRPLGVTMRDAVLQYVRAETAASRTLNVNLDGRFRAERNPSERDSSERDSTPAPDYD